MGLNESQRKLRDGLMIQVAMWADDNLFGAELPDDDYEAECVRLSDALYDEIYEALRSRPVR